MKIESGNQSVLALGEIGDFVEKWESELSEWAHECPRRDGMVKAMLCELDLIINRARKID